ncbi:MAG: hypothetical protein V4707_08485 [Pseudomonadota bacterium]
MLETLILLAGFVCLGSGMALAIYIDLNVRALKQSGALPPSSPVLFYGAMTIDITVLYGRAYRELNQDTRRVVPIIRVLIPLGFAIGAGFIGFLHFTGQMF